MNLESKLDHLIKKLSTSTMSVHPLHFWNETMNKPYTRYSSCGKNGIYARIDKLIKKASAAECLTSKYLYVRKAKMFFQNEEGKA